ncbi:P-loop containing nucleoside triphosphate hydrolase protein [Nemania serpens]|nr:P-loop containing nucleoside triphosphate hydrolase protein [Nemania serpens]
MLGQIVSSILDSPLVGQRGVDCRGRGRTVPMRVLVLGMGRTGTTSLRQALKRLGYEDTYHMMSTSVENPLDCLLWQQAFEAKFDGIGTFGRQEWDQLLGHCQAVADWPAIAFSEELLAAYPEAKVILPGRDVDSWHSSVLKTVYWRASDVELRVASYLDPAAGMYRPMLKKFFKTFFEDDFPNRGKEIFHEHYKNIRSLVPQEKLLEYNVKQGWDPLCKFLGEPVPFDPFPHVNDAKSFVARCRSRNRKQIAGGIFRILIAAYLLIWGCLSFTLEKKGNVTIINND